jgi:hypothetical protein
MEVVALAPKLAPSFWGDEYKEMNKVWAKPNLQKQTFKGYLLRCSELWAQGKQPESAPSSLLFIYEENKSVIS